MKRKLMLSVTMCILSLSFTACGLKHNTPEVNDISQALKDIEANNAE